jgi:hypothetical protein
MQLPSMTRPHLGRDPRHRGIARADKSSGLSDAGSGRERSPYSVLSLGGYLSGRLNAFVLLVPSARALATPARTRSTIRLRSFTLLAMIELPGASFIFVRRAASY